MHYIIGLRLSISEYSQFKKEVESLMLLKFQIIHNGILWRLSVYTLQLYEVWF